MFRVTKVLPALADAGARWTGTDAQTNSGLCCDSWGEKVSPEGPPSNSDGCVLETARD
jgi:hypothetical protein